MGKGQRRRARQRGGNPSVLSEEEIAFQRQLAKAQADSLRDQDQEASLRAWTGKHLEEMLGFPDTQEIVKHMMTMKTPQEVSEWVLNFTGSDQDDFVDEFFERRSKIKGHRDSSSDWTQRSQDGIKKSGKPSASINADEIGGGSGDSSGGAAAASAAAIAAGATSAAAIASAVTGAASAAGPMSAAATSPTRESKQKTSPVPIAGEAYRAMFRRGGTKQKVKTSLTKKKRKKKKVNDGGDGANAVLRKHRAAARAAAEAEATPAEKERSRMLRRANSATPFGSALGGGEGDGTARKLLVGNCLACGRICFAPDRSVLVELKQSLSQGELACEFCGTLLGQFQDLHGVDLLDDGRSIKGSTTVSPTRPNGSQPSRPRTTESLRAAEARRDRLLAFDRERSARSRVYDDDASDYADAQSAWSSAREREEAAAAAEQQKYDRTNRSRRAIKLNIGFGGNHVTMKEDTRSADKDAGYRRTKRRAFGGRRAFGRGTNDGLSEEASAVYEVLDGNEEQQARASVGFRPSDFVQ